MKIVELDSYAANPGDLSWDGLKALGELMLYDYSRPEEVVARAKDADAVLINKVNITDAVMAQLPKLKYIGVLATGFNVVDTAAANRRGIIVTNIPAYSTNSVVQMVFAHLLNATNQVAHYADENRKGRWSKNRDFCYWDTPLVELAGKSIGIVGLGHIGSRVAQLAHDFGMDVSALTSKNATELPEYIRKTTLEGLLSSCDVVTLHCPLTADNKGMINAERLQLMHPGAILINTGRGPLVDEQAVADALEAGTLGAYCADVMTEEPPRADNPLLRQPHAYITPHIAWATKEARQRLLDICVANLKAFEAGQPVNVVNR
ncbi:MAG: D-2-hydroxyacid dehydrogenase [Prevotella sp.]|nr:D-2-hydroxyacid dehydrogenase [Prevotella sp.]